VFFHLVVDTLLTAVSGGYSPHITSDPSRALSEDIILRTNYPFIGSDEQPKVLFRHRHLILSHHIRYPSHITSRGYVIDLRFLPMPSRAGRSRIF
jgi:hypothetical protein